MTSAPRHRTLHPPEEAVIEVGAFDSHGAARAVFKDRTLEVEHGIPGETVTGLVYGRRRRWAKIVEVVKASPDRVDAPCPHFHQGCGGCYWQMIDYDSQLARKVAGVESEMAANELSIPIQAIHRMDPPWRYRMTAALSLGHRVGFRRRGSQSIVGLDGCLISHPLIGELALHLNNALDAGRLPNYRGAVTLEVRVVDAGGEPGLHAAIIPNPGARDASIESIRPISLELARFGRTVGVLYRHRQQPPQLLSGEPFGTVWLEGKPFAVSAAGFFQTNTALLPALIQSLSRHANRMTRETLVDVYGGVGVFGLLLAPAAGRVVEIEIDPVGIEAARRSASSQHLSNVEFRQGAAESILPLISGVDSVIVDPPRAGLTPKVIQAIGRLRPQEILYVSCMARSLVRDILALHAYGYRAAGVEVFDFYPQTYHTELFATLEYVPGML